MGASLSGEEDLLRTTLEFCVANVVELFNLLEILQADSSLRRSSDESALLNKCATIKSNLVFNSAGRPHSPSPIEENDAADISCPQCGMTIFVDLYMKSLMKHWLVKFTVIGGTKPVV